MSASLVLVIGLLIAAVGLPDRWWNAVAPATTEPSQGWHPTIAASPSPSAVPSEVPGSDPADLPRYPGSTRTGFQGGVDGRVRWRLIHYTAGATTDDVRPHYRRVLREHDWFVGEVAYSHGAWKFDANRGSREVTVELMPTGSSTLVSVYLTDLIDRPSSTAGEGDDDDDDDDDGDDDD